MNCGSRRNPCKSEDPNEGRIFTSQNVGWRFRAHSATGSWETRVIKGLNVAWECRIEVSC